MKTALCSCSYGEPTVCQVLLSHRFPAALFHFPGLGYSREFTPPDLTRPGCRRRCVFADENMWCQQSHGLGMLDRVAGAHPVYASSLSLCVFY